MSPSTSESSNSAAPAGASASMNVSPTGVSESLVSPQWNIKDSPGSLPSIPPCYPMAKTSVLLRNTSLSTTDSADGGGNAKTTGLESDDYNTHSPSKVAHRIARCLRDRSIYAEYDAESATAVGTSVDHVELRIKLFHASVTPPQPPPAAPSTAAAGNASAVGDEDVETDSQSMATPAADAAAGGVVVEVTRKRGCTMSFHADCKAILSAARGVHVKRPSDNTMGGRERRGSSRPPPPLHRSQSMPAVTLATQNPATMDENVTLALETVEELLKKDRMDANLLGLQSLYMLSTDGNPESDKDKSAAYAAKMILLKHDGAETSSSILAMIGNLIRDWSINADDVFDDDSDSENDEAAVADQDGVNAEVLQGSGSPTFDDYYASTMHNLALGALSNILTLVCTETRWDDLPPQIRAWIEGEIVPLLVREVGLAAAYLAEVESESSATAAAEASSPSVAAADAPPPRQRTRPRRRVVRPHDASLAVRALTAIATMSPEMGAAALGMGLGTQLIALRDVGGTVHALLAEECATAMRTLNIDDNGSEGKAAGGR